jgi:hypothetical protein
MFLFIVASILLSVLAIQLRIISTTITDNVIIPLLIWTISLMSLQIFTLLAPYGLFGSIIAAILLWKIVYNWLYFIAEKSGNTNLMKVITNFDVVLNAPWNAVKLLWSTFTGLITLVKSIIGDVWLTIVTAWQEAEKIILNAWEIIQTVGNVLVGVFENTVKYTFNQIVGILAQIVSVGGLITDESILPPIPSELTVDKTYLNADITKSINSLYSDT